MSFGRVCELARISTLPSKRRKRLFGKKGKEIKTFENSNTRNELKLLTGRHRVMTMGRIPRAITDKDAVKVVCYVAIP